MYGRLGVIMHLHSLISTVLIFTFIPVEDGLQCNDTTANLTITVGKNIITAHIDENINIPYSTNYPEGEFTVKFQAGNPITTVSVQPHELGNCSYDGTAYGNYDYYGINFEGTLVAQTCNQNQRATDVFFVVVQVPISILANIPQSIEIKEYDTYSINCSATGNPPPTLEWNLTNHGNNVEQDIPFQTVPQMKGDVSSTVRLTIGSKYGALFNDSGDYQCFGSNSVNQDSVVVFQLSVHIAVDFLNSSESVTIEEGSSINISCEFRGFPNPQISWLDTSYISTIHIIDDIYSISTLHITSAKCEDEKEFMCFANNTVLSQENMNATGSSNISFKDPPPAKNLEAESGECNGTFMTISWEPENSWITNLTYQIQYSSSGESNATATATAQNSPTIIYTMPNTTYDISVIVISECYKKSEMTSTSVHTGIGLPSEPRNVTVLQNGLSCTVDWIEPETTYNNISQYTVFYQKCQGECKFDEYMEITCRAPPCNITLDDEPNLEYNIEVSAKNCAGIGPSEKSTQTCFTDTSASLVVTEIEFNDAPTNEMGTIELSPVGFNIEIPEQSEENGNISCYYVIMVKYDKMYQTPDQLQNRTIIDPTNLDEIADASVEEIQDGQPYFSVASNSSRTVFIGDGSTSTCGNIMTRSTDINNYYVALNRKLTPDRSYDMFIITTVPSVKDPTKMYSQTSNATFVNVVVISKSNEVPIAAIVVPIVIVVLFAVGFAVWYFKFREGEGKNTKTSEDIQIGTLTFDKEDLPPYDQPISQSRVRVSPAPSD